MPHATVPSPGLQALILCGPGLSLNTFTSTPKDLCKALIPIANRPMVWYPLDWCYRMGVHNITLITPAESASSLESALATHPALTSLPNPKPDVLAPADLTQTTGTGELLRLPDVQKIITSDFVVLPCDLISEVDGSKLVQQWMTLNPLSKDSLKTGGLGFFYPTYGLEGISTKKDETDFVATVPLASPPVPPPNGSLRSDIEEVVMSMPADTLNDKLEEDKGFLRVRQTLLNRHGRVKMRMKHRDAHVYIFPRWVKDFAAKNDRFDSISEDVLGWWVKARWQDGLSAKLGLDDALAEKKVTDEDGNEVLPDEEEVDPVSLSSSRSSATQTNTTRPAFATRVGSSAPQSTQPAYVPPLLAYFQPSPTPSTPRPLVRRVDTTHQLTSISLQIAKHQSPADSILAHEHKIHPSASIGMQSRISAEDCLVGENVTMGIRCNVKESVIGANCEIGNNVRLTKCVLMDGVVVGDGVQMVGCVVGRRARIEGTPIEKPAGGAGEAPAAVPATDGVKLKKKKGKDVQQDDDDKTRLTDCEVAPNFVVEAGTEAKGEKLMPFDTEDLEDLEDEEDEMDELEELEEDDM